MLNNYTEPITNTTEKMTVDELLAMGKTRIYPSSVNSYNCHSTSSKVPVDYIKCPLFDNIRNGDYSTPNTFYWISKGNYLDITLDKYTNIYRCGTVSYSHYNNPLTIISVSPDGTENDVTSLYSNEYVGMPMLAENEVFLSFLSIKPGRYIFKYKDLRMDSEWFMYEDRSKELSYYNNTSYLFDDRRHMFKEESISEDNITDNYILEKGSPKGIIFNTFNNRIIETELIDNTDNYTITVSEEIQPSWNISSIEEMPGTDWYYEYNLSCSPFIPIKDLNSDYLLYSIFESPEIISLDLEATETHNQNITLYTRIRYDKNKKIKIRLKINTDEYTSWTNFISPMTKKELIIPYNKLIMGDNDITLEVQTDDGKSISKTLYNAVVLINAEPTITIINKNSNNFKINFIINDVDTSDTVKYQLTLKNSKIGSRVVVPWSDYKSTPYEVKYTFDTSIVEVDKINTLFIEFEDMLGGRATTNYSFLGEYSNILFADENGKYYTTDTGQLIKMLNFGNLISGSTTDIKKICVKNNNQDKIYHLIISTTGNNSNIMLEISKTSNPFIPGSHINYGDEVIDVGETREFYARVFTTENAKGITDFQIEALADLII